MFAEHSRRPAEQWKVRQQQCPECREPQMSPGLCTRCQTTPTWHQWVFYKLQEVLFPCFLPKNIDPFSVALLLDPFFLSQQLLNSTFKSLKNNPVSMHLQNIWQRNADLGTTPSQRWGLVHQKKKGKADCQILEQDAHVQCSALAYLLLTAGTDSKLGYWFTEML